jgi:hypothetical protein
MEEQQMEIDSGIEENEEHVEMKKEEQKQHMALSPPIYSYSQTRKCNEDPTIWNERKAQLELAYENLIKMSKQLDWLSSPTTKMLAGEFLSQASFYKFLLETKSVISFTDWGYFCVLPTEVIMYILSYLDAQSLCRLAQVNKDFSILTSEEPLWKGLTERLNFPAEDKPECRTWKWLCQSRLRKFKEGEERNGGGTYYFPGSGKKGMHCYSGDWLNNKRHGYGSFYWEKDAGKHTGEWRDDKREGPGIRIWPNGNKYVGEYKNHKRHGKGTFTFSNGSKFTGIFEENKFSYGTYTWPNDRVYEGEWNNTNRHGCGTYWWPDGRIYKGEWKNDKRHGKATYHWPDGDYFEGEFVEGARWGKGVLYCKTTNETYDQEWKEVKFDEHNKGIPSAESNSQWSVCVSVKRKSSFEDSDQKRKSPKYE